MESLNANAMDQSFTNQDGSPQRRDLRGYDGGGLRRTT